VANLKDSKNPELRANVLCGLIPADRIAKMTADVGHLRMSLGLSVAFAVNVFKEEGNY